MTFFVPDARKCGGAYVSKTAEAGKVDELAETLLLADGSAIPFREIYSIEIL